MNKNASPSSVHGLKGSRLKEYTVFYRVIEDRCAIVRATSPKQAQRQVELYLDNGRTVPASVHVDTQSLVTEVRDCGVEIEVHQPEIGEEDLPY